MKLSKHLALVAAAASTWAPLSAPAMAQKARKPSAAALSKGALGGARVFIKYSLQYYPTSTTTFNHLLLFPDGTAFDDIPTKPLSQFSAPAIKRLLDSRDVGRWKASGSTILLTFPRGKRTLRKHSLGWFDGEGAIPKESAYDVYYPVAGPPRARLLGAWKSDSLVVMGTQGGGAPMVAAGSSGDWKFNADGTFSDGSESFTSSTTQNMGDVYKGDGDVVSTSRRSRKSSGKWRLDGPMLSVEKNGVRTVHLAFLMPHWTKNMANTDLMVDGDRWKRPEKKQDKK